MQITSSEMLQDPTFLPVHDDVNSPPSKFVRVAQKKWRDNETDMLVNSLCSYNRIIPINEWNDADWADACKEIMQKSGFTLEQCKGKRKRLSDYLLRCEKENTICARHEQLLQIRVSKSTARNLGRSFKDAGPAASNDRQSTTARVITKGQCLPAKALVYSAIVLLSGD